MSLPDFAESDMRLKLMSEVKLCVAIQFLTRLMKVTEMSPTRIKVIKIASFKHYSGLDSAEFDFVMPFLVYHLFALGQSPFHLS